MDEQNHIPNPIDLRLAQLLDHETDSFVSDDPLLPLLQSYKNSSTLRVLAKADNDIWRSIESKITKQEAKIYRLPARWLQVAAVIFFALFIGLFIRFYTQPTHQLLASSEGSIVSFTMSDGSVATLRPWSELYLSSKSDQEYRYSIKGEVHFDVVTNPERIFSVEAGSGVVKVLGTTFTLSLHENETRVYLEKGSVQFSLADNSDSIILQPGEFSEIKNGVIRQPIPSESQRFTSWLNNLIVLDNRTAEDLIRELELHFNISIRIAETYSEEKLSGQLLLDDAGNVLEYIGLSLNGYFVETKPGEFIFTPDQ
jgi:ferric-dicitrate binding protein FerR (iron transport regulator)